MSSTGTVFSILWSTTMEKNIKKRMGKNRSKLSVWILVWGEWGNKWTVLQLRVQDTSRVRGAWTGDSWQWTHTHTRTHSFTPHSWPQKARKRLDFGMVLTRACILIQALGCLSEPGCAAGAIAPNPQSPLTNPQGKNAWSRWRRLAYLVT